MLTCQGEAERLWRTCLQVEGKVMRSNVKLCMPIGPGLMQVLLQAGFL